MKPRMLLLLSAMPVVAGAFGRDQGEVRVVLVDTAVIAAPRLGESSGVASSSRVGVYWTHNDSGDDPFLYATDSAGRDLGRWRIQGAAARDWEDMAAGPCVVRPGRCLYLADIGDNRRRRPHVVIYRLEEPEPPLHPAGDGGVVPLLDSIVLRYADTPHNAEGLAVTADGRLLITAKELSDPALLYWAPAHQPHATLAVLCTLNVRTDPLRGRIVTGLALSPDGRFLAVRTYSSLHFYRADGGCSALTPPNGLVIPVVETQGEAITFDRGNDRLVMTSERGPAGHAILTRLRVEGLP
jgi:hypothetical protein